MIVRTWRAHAASSNSLAYVAHFRRDVVPTLRRVTGFLGATLLTADHGDVVEFLVLTRWTSIEAIRGFAGDDVERAVVDPDAVAALVSFDRTVHHYEVLEEVIDTAST
jgi:heme-degrading monooxygenase HmoA